jgi:hypothetical protein
MTWTSRQLAGFVLGGAAALVACRSGDKATPDSTAASSRDAGSLEGARKDTAHPMAAMPGMAGAAMANGMMDSMEVHMRSMTTASTDHIKALVPEHRQMVANMLSQMTQEMRSMNMPADAAWTATVDSVRQDLIHLPEMTGSDLNAMMPAHHARISRLLQMHRDMMGKMKP